MSRISESAELYAEYLRWLLDNGDCWARRRVVSCTVVDGDTMQIQVSLDFDLTQCDIGRMYLKAMRDYLPLLLPIGLYLEPYVGFDLRDSGDSRISFIAQRERIEVTERIKAIEREMEGESDLLSVLDEQGLTIAIAELPANGSCSSGRLRLRSLPISTFRENTGFVADFTLPCG
jgi:hypothetical protein